MTTPEKLGKFTITGVLGKGAMGVVYKAYDPDIKRPVAVKTIRNDWADEVEYDVQTLAARFRHEAQAAGRLTHPGIVGVYEYGEDAGFTYIAMEYVEGNSLREYFTRKIPFSEKDVISLMSQLLEGLAAAHEQGVWHRDIKPANLIVTSNGRLKIADFGVARIEASELTQMSELLGTHGYIAPECYKGAAIDHRSDLFAAGSVLYQLLAGTSPFAGTAEAVMYRVCNIDPVPPSQCDPARNWPHYDLAALTALAKDAERRFQSAHAFRDALLAAYAGPVGHSISEATIITQRTPRPVPASTSTSDATAGSARSVHQSAASLGSTGPMPTSWDANLLTHVEACLAQFVGPVARVMVRRTARTIADLPSLVEQLSAQLATDEDRRAFVARVTQLADPTIRAALGIDGAGASMSGAARGSMSGSVLPGTAASSFAPTTEQLTRANQALSRCLGPIAKVLVKRAAAQAADLAAFHQALAQGIDDEAERKRFLQDVGKG